MIKIEIAGVKELETRLLSIPKRVERAVLVEMAQLIHEKALDGADKHTKTGALLQSLYNRPIPGGREIGHDPKRAPHAVFVHWGTRPHLIKPKEDGTYKSFKDIDGKTVRKGIKKGGVKRQMLRWASGGLFHFAKVVHHPGYKGDPYLTQAAHQALLQFDAIVARHLKGI